MHELEDLLKEDVRGTAPQPRDEFLSRMEDQVQAGFPKKRRRLWPIIEPYFPILATVAVFAAIVLPLALFGEGGGDDDSASSGQVVDAMSGTESGGSGASEAAPDTPELSAEARQAAPASGQDAAAGGADQAPGRRDRLVERKHALTVSTPADEFDETTAEVLNVADTTGSIVQSSNVTERDNRGLATFDLRVPASSLDDVLRDLSRLGKVTERRASSDDITGTYVSAQNRLEDARDTRRALLRALERADSGAEADALRARIADARRRIAAAERDVRRTRARADRARVALTIESSGEISEEGSTWTPGDAASDAWRVLEVIVGVALIALAVIAPFALLALIAVALGRLLRRRRREAALG